MNHLNEKKVTMDSAPIQEMSPLIDTTIGIEAKTDHAMRTDAADMKISGIEINGIKMKEQEIVVIEIIPNLAETITAEITMKAIEVHEKEITETTWNHDTMMLIGTMKILIDITHTAMKTIETKEILDILETLEMKAMKVHHEIAVMKMKITLKTIKIKILVMVTIKTGKNNIATLTEKIALQPIIAMKKILLKILMILHTEKELNTHAGGNCYIQRSCFASKSRPL